MTPQLGVTTYVGVENKKNVGVENKKNYLRIIPVTPCLWSSVECR